MKVLQIIWKYESNATNNNPSQQSKFLIENELLAARAVAYLTSRFSCYLPSHGKSFFKEAKWVRFPYNDETRC